MSPLKAPSPCRSPGCPRVTTEGYCQDHKRTPWENKNDTPQRVTGRKLQEKRRYLLTENPWCAECLKKGTHTPAQYRDHIVPLSQGGKDVFENTQGLCKHCHDIKTQNESRQGRKGNVNR